VPIDAHEALSAEPTRREVTWSERDVLLYHLSLGAGADPARGPELRWTYERDLQVLPTFALVAGEGISAGPRQPVGLALPGLDVDLRKILHAGQSLVVHRPLPTSGTATVTSRTAAVWDKGKAAVVELEQHATDPAGDPLWTTTMQVWARGEGGFGGEPGPDAERAQPAGAPEVVLTSRTSPAQALLYRLNGDLNPLHVDPQLARQVGFDRPILHGLATYGVVSRALVESLGEGDAARLTAVSVRFAGILVPGESLRTSVWRDGADVWFSAVCPERGDAPVLSHGTARVSA
jgi:acyl dehydratase